MDLSEDKKISVNIHVYFMIIKRLAISVFIKKMIKWKLMIYIFFHNFRIWV